MHRFLLTLSRGVFVTVAVPKVDQINQRLGPLAQEFTELVYPAGYNPEIKPAPKRKSGQGWGAVERPLKRRRHPQPV